MEKTGKRVKKKVNKFASSFLRHKFCAMNHNGQTDMSNFGGLEINIFWLFSTTYYLPFYLFTLSFKIIRHTCPFGVIVWIKLIFFELG
jgi:hypothetical protein